MVWTVVSINEIIFKRIFFVHEVKEILTENLLFGHSDGERKEASPRKEAGLVKTAEFGDFVTAPSKSKTVLIK